MSGPAGSFVTTGVQVISNMLCEQIKEAPRVQELRLGIDLACRESHRAALADETGKILWSNRRLFTTSVDLQSLWTAVRAAGDVPVLVVMEPTRNAWVPVAAWLRARGADVRMVPPEQSADLRKYYNKHTKTDRLDCELLARLPLLHPDGLVATPGLGPAEALRRSVAHRQSLVARRTAGLQRLDALLGPAWTDVLGTDFGKAALTVLERYADPDALFRLGRARLTQVLIRASRGQWRQDKADELLDAAAQTRLLWAGGGLVFAELADDIAVEARLVRQLGAEIDQLDDRITTHYQDADPTGIVASAPGVGPVLAPLLLGRLGDAKRFRDLAAVRNYTGLVPKVNQSGTSDHTGGLTKAGDPLLREALFMAADHARKVDPTLAARYWRLRAADKHHNSALCTLAAVLVTRIAACWRNDQQYILRDLNGNPITETQGRAQCADLKPTPTAKAGTGRRNKESHSAPSTGPSTKQATKLRKSA
jgi:transposase